MRFILCLAVCRVCRLGESEEQDLPKRFVKTKWAPNQDDRRIVVRLIDYKMFEWWDLRGDRCASMAWITARTSGRTMAHHSSPLLTKLRPAEATSVITAAPELPVFNGPHARRITRGQINKQQHGPRLPAVAMRACVCVQTKIQIRLPRQLTSRSATQQINTAPVNKLRYSLRNNWNTRVRPYAVTTTTPPPQRKVPRLKFIQLNLRRSIKNAEYC